MKTIKSSLITFAVIALLSSLILASALALNISLENFKLATSIIFVLIAFCLIYMPRSKLDTIDKIKDKIKSALQRK